MGRRRSERSGKRRGRSSFSGGGGFFLSKAPTTKSEQTFLTLFA